MNQNNRLDKPCRHDTQTEGLDWSKPLVTIRCIAYNQEKYIRDALEGFVTQETDFPFEAIVHDDASPDGTAAIIRDYAEKYPHIIKPIYQTENQYSKGKDGRMWRDINNATSQQSKYIAYCEGDDYWTKPYKLQKQVNFMEEHPEITLCFHNAMFHFEEGVTDRFVKYRNEDGTPKNYLVAENLEDQFYNFEETFYSWFHPTASWVIRKEVFDSPEYAKMCTIPTPNGDDKIRFTCAHLGKLYSFAEAMSVYRIQPDGVSQRFGSGKDIGYITRYHTLKHLNKGLKFKFKNYRFYQSEFSLKIIQILKDYRNFNINKCFFKTVFNSTPMTGVMFVLFTPLEFLRLFCKKVIKKPDN